MPIRFFNYLCSLKDHTRVYNLAQKETWDAHGLSKYPPILLEKMNFSYLTDVIAISRKNCFVVT